MPRVEIGGVTVARNKRILWRQLMSVLIAGPLLAFFTGWIEGVQLFLGGVSGLIRGLGEFLESLIFGFYLSGRVGIERSWSTFYQEVEATFGVFTFLVVSAMVGLTLVILSEWVSRLYG